MDPKYYYYVVDNSSKKKYYNILTGKQVSAYSIKKILSNIQRRNFSYVQLRKMYNDKKVLTQRLQELNSTLDNINNILLTFTDSQKSEYIQILQSDNQLKKLYLDTKNIGSDDDVIYPKI